MFAVPQSISIICDLRATGECVWHRCSREVPRKCVPIISHTPACLSIRPHQRQPSRDCMQPPDAVGSRRDLWLRTY